MYILGIGCYYHDSSAAVLKDGKIVAAVEEERFTRVKHDNSFPVHSINFCLQAAGIEINQIDYVAFYEKPFLKFERILYQCINFFPNSYKLFVKAMPAWLTEKIRIRKILKRRLGYKGPILFIDHHLSHAAHFFVSPFERAAVVTIDGVGEMTTTAFGVGQGNYLRLDKKINFPDSLGLLYSAVTAYLGFKVNNDEYKVMGLSAYGNQDKQKNIYYQKFKRLIDIKNDGSFRLDMNYFNYHFSDRMLSDKFFDFFGGQPRKPNTAVTVKEKDIAAALQLVYEEILFKILNYVYLESGLENLVIGGGCALNSLANGKILANTPFKNVWVSPSVSDGGASLGAALFVANDLLGIKRCDSLTNSYLGPEFSDESVLKVLNQYHLSYQRLDNESLILKIAEELLKDKIIGWFRGRMEFGPRALGARSILANPFNQDIQNILNEKIKKRESFRPFAPVVCRDDVKIFFDDEKIPECTDFMTMVLPFKEEWYSKIPGVVHIDGTGRLQTVSEDQNQIYYRLIKQFGELSGASILINTSFNSANEPIVCTPKDALKSFLAMNLDCLVLNNFLIKNEKI